VLAAAARLRGAQVLAVTSTNPLAACAIAARAGDETTVLVANTTARELATELLGTRGPARIRRLNAASAARAGLDPVAFRSESAALEGTSIVLGPYETAQVEFAS
jgi:hypothetical protein